MCVYVYVRICTRIYFGVLCGSLLPMGGLKRPPNDLVSVEVVGKESVKPTTGLNC